MKGLLTPERLNALEALVGLGLVVWGIGAYSVPAAAIVLGAVLFIFAAWPHLWRPR